MSRTPYRVGLTGTVAAGKSTVGKLFESWGAELIDADVLAREAVRLGSPGLERIREVWGDDVLDRDGGLNRRALARIVFDDPGARDRIESIVHPEVRRLRADRLDSARARGVRIVVDEIPLLFENDLADEFDEVIVVDALRDVRAQRAQENRGWTEADFDAVEASQLAADEKRSRADHVIDNSGDVDRLNRAAREQWTRIETAADAHETGRVDAP